MTPPTQKLTILIVSNHARMARVLQREIILGGHVQIIAESEAEALAVAGTSYQDIILMDSSLCGESTVSLATRLNAIRPVAILLLAHSIEEIAPLQGAGVEISGCLLKPFTSTALWSAIDDAFGAGYIPREEEKLMPAPFDRCIIDQMLFNAAQIAMRWMDCEPANAYQAVADLAASRARELRSGIGVAA